jgi:Zn-dependent M28 family amino/carboxypeptidase
MVCWTPAPVNAGGEGEHMKFSESDIRQIEERLKAHLRALTITIGERSVRYPGRLTAAAEYITAFYEGLGISVHTEPYRYQNMSVANVVAEIASGPEPSARYIVGAHYDSVTGTVGADDNASAVAVQLETARRLQEIIGRAKIDVGVKFVSFALEEPPVYATGAMGSRVYAEKARLRNEKIDGMICLEMVGYTCSEPGCQRYPFPLSFFGYPEDGTFIGIVGNTRSRAFTRELAAAFQKNPHLPVVKLTVPFNGRILPAVRLSDHASFWDNGYRAVMVTDSAFFRNPHYHLPSDTMNTLDYRFMAELVKCLTLFFK